MSHARLAPSACSRWSTCTASVGLLEQLRTEGKIPERSTSVFAAEGTVAHMVRDLCLTLGLDPHHFVGMVASADGYTFTVDDEMADYLQRGIDWIRERTGDPDVEIVVDLSPWLPGQFGTCDTGWIQDDTLVVNDLKYGAGEPVSAIGNKQLRLYALGYWHFKGRPKVERVLLLIDQPRAGGFKEWEISLADLIAFGEEMKAVYARIAAGDVEFAPSDAACRWCAADTLDGGCGARNKWLLNMIVDEFDDLEGEEANLIDPDRLTPDRRWHIVKHAPQIRAWLAKLHEQSIEAALLGNPDPGSKVIIGDLGNRYFTDPKKAEQLLVEAVGDAAYKPRDIIGVPDAQKLTKPGRKKPGHPATWEALQKLVDRPEGKPKLVPEDHPSEPMKALADEFDDL